MINAYIVLVGKPERKGLLVRSGRRLKDSINRDLKYCIRTWTGFIWRRVRSGRRLL